MPNCINCGNLLNPMDVKCWRCGAPVNPYQSQTEQTAYPQQQPQYIQQPQYPQQEPYQQPPPQTYTSQQPYLQQPYPPPIVMQPYVMQQYPQQLYPPTQYSPREEEPEEDEIIKPSQGLILTILFGCISGAMMIVGTLLVWVFDKWIDNGISKTLDYRVNTSPEFYYLYIVLVLGFIVLLLSVLVPILQHKIPNPRFFAVIILFFCIMVLFISIAGVQHMTSRANNPDIGPGGVISMVGAIFGIPAAFLFLRTLRNTGPILEFRPEEKQPKNKIR